MPANERNSALVDWTVLLAGIVMLALSVAPAVTQGVDRVSGEAADRADPGQDWLPS